MSKRLEKFPRLPDDLALMRLKLTELHRDIAELVNGILPYALWTPILTNTTNVTASTADECFYQRTGDVVHFSGTLSVDPTVASTQTVVGISIPIPSDFQDVRDARGIAVRGGTGVVNIGGVVLANTTDNRLTLSFFCDTDVADRGWSFHGMYKVI